MTAVILPFPAYHVRIAREHPAWMVICRDHGWLHGSHADAAANAGLARKQPRRSDHRSQRGATPKHPMPTEGDANAI